MIGLDKKRMALLVSSVGNISTLVAMECKKDNFNVSDNAITIDKTTLGFNNIYKLGSINHNKNLSVDNVNNTITIFKNNLGPNFKKAVKNLLGKKRKKFNKSINKKVHTKDVVVSRGLDIDVFYNRIFEYSYLLKYLTTGKNFHNVLTKKQQKTKKGKKFIKVMGYLRSLKQGKNKSVKNDVVEKGKRLSDINIGLIDDKKNIKSANIGKNNSDNKISVEIKKNLLLNNFPEKSSNLNYVNKNIINLGENVNEPMNDIILDKGNINIYDNNNNIILDKDKDNVNIDNNNIDVDDVFDNDNVDDLDGKFSLPSVLLDVIKEYNGEDINVHDIIRKTYFTGEDIVVKNSSDDKDIAKKKNQSI